MSDLPPASSPRLVELDDGDVFEIRIGQVRKRIGDVAVGMLAYNGSIPGPTLRVMKGAAVTVQVTNETDMETTVHWHGLRLENRFDGVPGDTQESIRPNGTFSYRLHFPDEGIYWYHPHMREDYAQEMGLYGAILVVPTAPDYWPSVHRGMPLMLDDVLLEGDRIAPFSGDNMGRFGNVYLVNGATSPSIEAVRGEVIRLYLTNVANVRDFNLGIPGASMKLVGADLGRCEREQFVDRMTLAPGERAVVDVLFGRAGPHELQHHRPQGAVALASFTVADGAAQPPLHDEYHALRSNPELQAERLAIAADLERPPDKVLELVGEMPRMGDDAHESICRRHELRLGHPRRDGARGDGPRGHACGRQRGRNGSRLLEARRS